jgi:hypothetical protein
MSKQVGMSLAVGLVGVGLVLNALPKFGVGAATANAAPVADLAGDLPPTIVWYGSGFGQSEYLGAVYVYGAVYRAWSDGTVEMKRVTPYAGSVNNGYCEGTQAPCASPWFIISSPTEGLAAASDTNFDTVVDGADLANLLAAWGPAPRSPIPLSDCPLDLILP